MVGPRRHKTNGNQDPNVVLGDWVYLRCTTCGWRGRRRAKSNDPDAKVPGCPKIIRGLHGPVTVGFPRLIELATGSTLEVERRVPYRV